MNKFSTNGSLDNNYVANKGIESTTQKRAR